MAGLGGRLQAPALVPRSLPGSWRVSASCMFRAAFPRRLSCVPALGVSRGRASPRSHEWSLFAPQPGHWGWRHTPPQLFLRPVSSGACRQGVLEGSRGPPGAPPCPPHLQHSGTKGQRTCVAPHSVLAFGKYFIFSERLDCFEIGKETGSPISLDRGEVRMERRLQRLSEKWWMGGWCRCQGEGSRNSRRLRPHPALCSRNSDASQEKSQLL